MRVLSAATIAVALLTAACSGGDDGDVAAFCAQAEGARVETIFDGLDPTDVTGSLAAFRAARDEERALADVAPSGVRDDVEILVEFLDDLIDGLESTEADERPDVYDELRPRFDEVEAAGDRLELYVSTSC